MRVDKQTTLVQVLEKFLDRPLAEPTREAFAETTVHQFWTYFHETAPRPVERSQVPWHESVWELAAVAGRRTTGIGPRLVAEHGPAPKPGIIEGELGKREMTEAEIASAGPRLFGDDLDTSGMSADAILEAGRSVGLVPPDLAGLDLAEARKKLFAE